LATDEKVYVYTPQGDIVELPLGSTPIDFAYCIHTEVGHTCRGAYINGKYVALNYHLHDGDIVEIKTEKRGGPSRDWLNENLGYVRTNRARRKIKHWFKRQDYPDNVRQGREMLEKELKRLGIRELNWEQLAHKLKYNTLDDFLAAVGYNDISLQQVIRIVQEMLPDSIQPSKKRSSTFTQTNTNQGGVKIIKVGNLLTTMANCCHPLPGESIVGFVTRNRGVTIHRQDCLNVINSQEPERLISVAWEDERPETYIVYIVVSAFDRQALTRDITDVLAREKINIVNLSVDTYPEENMAAIYLTLDVRDLEQLQRVMDQMEQVPNVFDVLRKG
jgi:GTP pyrophosphokinase